MKEFVLDFINRRWKDTDANWLNGNCYWFARILADRFPYLEIYYLPIEGHFVAGDYLNKEFYDWNGEVELKEEPINMGTIALKEPEWYKRLIRDCVQ